MFEYKQDIAILEGALLSVTKTFLADGQNTVSSLPEDKFSDYIEVIQDSIQMVVKGQSLGVCKSWSQFKANETSRRLHAAMFYSILKTNGISCPEADKVYQNSLGHFPCVSWKLYIVLLSRCHWCQYYIECVSQLPECVMLNIVKSTLKHHIDPNVPKSTACIYHCVVQSVLYKLFNTSKVSSPCAAFPINFPFDFPFEMENVKEFSFVQDPLLKTLLQCSQSNTSAPDNVKVLLHALVTSVDLLSNWEQYVSICDVIELSLESRFSILEKYVEVFKEKLLSEEGKGILSDMLQNFDYQHFLDAFLSGVDFEFEVGFVVFLLSAKCDVLKEKLADKMTNMAIESALMKCIMRIGAELVEISKSLMLLHPLVTHGSEMLVEDFVKMLAYVVDNNMAERIYTFKFVLQDPFLLKKEKVLQFLDNNYKVLCEDISGMSFFMEVAFVIRSPVLVKLFIKMFVIMPFAKQYQLFEEYVTKHGPSSALKLPDYEIELSSFLARTSNLSETLEMLLPLCLQCTQETLANIIKKIVRHGIVSLFMIEALKSAPVLCLCKIAPTEPTLLVQCLRPYFGDFWSHMVVDLNNEMEQKMKQNILFLIELLIKVFDGMDVFPSSEFVMLCILPYLDPSVELSSMVFSLEVLNLILIKSLNSADISWFIQLNVGALLFVILQLVNISIVSYNCKLKELLVSILGILHEMQGKFEDLTAYLNNASVQKWLRHSISQLKPVTQCYSFHFVSNLNTSLNHLSLPELICHFVVNEMEDVTPLKQRLETSGAYTDLAVLQIASAQILPHFTDTEFQKLSSLFCHKDIDILRSSIDVSNFGSYQVSEEDLRRISFLELLVDVLLLMKKCENQQLDWLYILACALKAIKNETTAIEHSLVLLIKAFFEVCRLAEVFRKQSELFKALVCSMASQIRTAGEKDDKLFQTSMKYLLCSVDMLSLDGVSQSLLGKN